MNVLRKLRAAVDVPLRCWSKFRCWYLSLTRLERVTVQNAFVWGVTLLCIWWVSRGVSFHGFIASLKQANIGLFVVVNVISFLVAWLGDTFLYSTLFNFFYKRTRFRELLPATAAQYFLQAVNSLAAGGALVVFLNRRKGVKWFTAIWTLMFQGLIDALVLASTAVLAGLLVPSSLIRDVLPYAAAVLVFLLAVAMWWARGRPKTEAGKWMYHRPSARLFREAGLREYLALGSIRLAQFSIEGFLYYYSIKAFAHAVPLAQTVALTPAIQATKNEPVTPQGLGPLQAVVVGGLSRYAPHDKILAAALGISILALLCRLPLGLGSAGLFARSVLEVGPGDQDESDEHTERIKERHVSAAPDTASRPSPVDSLERRPGLPK